MAKAKMVYSPVKKKKEDSCCSNCTMSHNTKGLKHLQVITNSPYMLLLPLTLSYQL
jgi:hypothetical protein